MYCCIYSAVIEGKLYYGILDTSDNTVENHTEANLLNFIQMGYGIAGLTLSRGVLNYHGKVRTKFEPDEVIEGNGFTLVAKVTKRGYHYSGFALVFRESAPDKVSLVREFEAEHYMEVNSFVPLDGSSIRLSFRYTDKHYYREDREETFFKALSLDVKTGEYKVDSKWSSCR